MKKAFEVEDILDRTNYSFVLDKDKVYLYNTSINHTPIVMFTFPDDTDNIIFDSLFPFGCESSEEYFDYVYNKALNDTEVCFLGWVDSDTFEPLEEE